MKQTLLLLGPDLVLPFRVLWSWDLICCWVTLPRPINHLSNILPLSTPLSPSSLDGSPWTWSLFLTVVLWGNSTHTILFKCCSFACSIKLVCYYLSWSYLLDTGFLNPPLVHQIDRLHLKLKRDLEQWVAEENSDGYQPAQQLLFLSYSTLAELRSYSRVYPLSPTWSYLIDVTLLVTCFSMSMRPYSNQRHDGKSTRQFLWQGSFMGKKIFLNKKDNS